MITLDRPPTPILNNSTSFWFVFVEEIRKMCAFGEQAVLPKSKGNVFGNSLCRSEKQKKSNSEDFSEKTLMPAEHCNLAKQISTLKSCSSIPESSYLKNFQWALVFRRQSSVFLVVLKAWRDCSKPPIKNSEEDQNKEAQLLPGKAPAEEISVDAAVWSVYIRSGQHSLMQRRAKNSNNWPETQFS